MLFVVILLIIFCTIFDFTTGSTRESAFSLTFRIIAPIISIDRYSKQKQTTHRTHALSIHLLNHSNAPIISPPNQCQFLFLRRRPGRMSWRFRSPRTHHLLDDRIEGAAARALDA